MNKNTIFFASAQISERLVSFFLLPLLTNLVSQAEYAIWSQSIVISGIMMPLVLLGFSTAVVKFLPEWEGQERVQESVLLLMLTTVLVVLAIISFFAISFDRSAAILVFGDSEQYIYIPLVVGMLLSEALFDLLASILRASERIQRVSIYLFLKGVWRIGAFLLVLIGTGGGFYEAFWAFVFFQLIITLAIYIKEVGLTKLATVGFNLGYNKRAEILLFSLL